MFLNFIRLLTCDPDPLGQKEGHSHKSHQTKDEKKSQNPDYIHTKINLPSALGFGQFIKVHFD